MKPLECFFEIEDVFLDNLSSADGVEPSLTLGFEPVCDPPLLAPVPISQHRKRPSKLHTENNCRSVMNEHRSNFLSNSTTAENRNYPLYTSTSHHLMHVLKRWCSFLQLKFDICCQTLANRCATSCKKPIKCCRWFDWGKQNKMHMATNKIRERLDLTA